MNRRLLALFAMVVLLFPLLAACGNDGGGTTTDGGGGTVPEAAQTETGGDADTGVPTELPATDGETEATPTTSMDGAMTPEAGATQTADGGMMTPAAGETAGTTPAAGETAMATATGEGSGAAATFGDECAEKRITIGSKNFTEQFVLGELYAQALEARGWTVERRLNLGSEQIADRALLSGQIDMYPEYTGTMLQAILKSDQEFESPEAQEAFVREQYAQRDPSLTVLDTAPFDNNYAIVVRREAAEQYGLETIADVAENAENLTFASFGEFEDRSDGRPNVEENYPGFENLETRIVNSLGLRYQALENGQADVGVGFRTDGQLASENLMIVEDPKSIWPPYYPAPVVRTEYLESCPAAANVMNEVSATLTQEAMQRMNGGVDLEREDPEDVAQAFLEEQGLLEGQ